MTARRGWPEDVRQRCFVLWCGRGNRNASRTAWLFREEHPDASGPAPSTIRRWAHDEGWSAWAGEHPPPMPGQHRDQWTTMWRRHMLRHVDAVLRLQRDLLLGVFDGDQAAAEASLTEADASMTHLLAQPAVLGLLRAAFREEAAPPVFVATRECQAWERLVPRTTEAYRYHRQP
jgi:hypothetical protein